MSDTPPSSSFLYGSDAGSHGRRIRLENVVVLDASGPRIWFDDKVAGLEYLNNLREEARDGERRAMILRVIGTAGAVKANDLGKAVYGVDYGPVYGRLALEGLINSLKKLFLEIFEIAPIRYGLGGKCSWSPEIGFREGTIREGRVVDVAP